MLLSLNMAPKNRVTTFFNKIADLQFSSSVNCWYLNILKGHCQTALPPCAAFYWEGRCWKGAREEKEKEQRRKNRAGRQADRMVGKAFKIRRNLSVWKDLKLRGGWLLNPSLAPKWVMNIPGAPNRARLISPRSHGLSLWLWDGDQAGLAAFGLIAQGVSEQSTNSVPCLKSR